MLRVYANNNDITKNVRFGSIRITEQLNNRANTCSLSVDQYTIGEGAKIEVFEGFKLTAEALSGQAVLNVDDTFENEAKFRPGDEVILKIKDATQQRKTILSIDHVAKTITLSSNLSTTLPQWSTGGRLVFAGVTMKNPDEEIGMTGSFSYKINATDRTKIFDAKVVVETFENQYSREILGRMVREYCANDSETILDLFETAWTAGGVGSSMVLDTADRIQGSGSMKTGTSGAGTATRTKTISSVDLTGKDCFRLWHKVKEGFGNKISSLKFRVGNDASNYYEGMSARIGQSNEDCWNYEAFRFDRSLIVGAPDLATIDRIQIEVVSTASISNGILFDEMISSSGGFTLNNSIRGDKKLEDVRAQYKKPTVFVEDISKLQNFFRFVDYERDLHFFKNNSTAAPFGIDDSSMNYSELSITADISQLKNRQTVRGGEAIEQTLYTQDEVTDGKAESRRLDYKPKGLQIWVDTTGTGSSFVQKTVGIENLDEPSTVDYLFNFNEKIVRKANATTPPAGAIFRRVYYPYKPIRVRVKNNDSIEAMKALLGGDGIFDGAAINDASIRDRNEARARAKAEVDAYCNPILTANFETQVDGLKAGQIIHIIDTSRGIDQDFLIQRISKSSRKNERRNYSVECGSTMFGIIEFFQMLLKRSEKLMIDVSEVVDIVQNVDETIKILEFYSGTKKSKTFRAGTVLKKVFDFTAEDAGSPTTVFDTDWRMYDVTSQGILGSFLNTGTTYSHLIDVGNTTDIVVNGVTMNRSVGEGARSYTGFDLSITNNLGGGTVIGSERSKLEEDFIYSSIAGSTNTITLSGLEVGKRYTFTSYQGDRTGGAGPQFKIVSDDGKDTGFMNRNAHKISTIDYIATSTTKQFSYIGNPSTGPHLYAFTNAERKGFKEPANQRQRKQTKTSNVVGTAGFGNSNHSNGKEMALDVDSYSGGSSGQSLTIDQRNTFEAKASTNYRATARIENKLIDGLVGGNGLTLQVDEIGYSTVKYNNTFLDYDGVNDYVESNTDLYSSTGSMTAVGTTITEALGLIIHNGTAGSYFTSGTMPFNNRSAASYFFKRFKVNSLAAVNTLLGRNFSTYAITSITVETDGKVQVEIQGTGSARIKANTTVLTAGTEYNIGVRVNNYLDPLTARATSDIDIFINGVKQSLSITATGNNTAVSTNVYIGSYNTTINPLNGSWADILIYKKALTDSEMSGICQSPINEFIDNIEDCVRRRNGLHFWQPAPTTYVTGVENIVNRQNILYRTDNLAIFCEFAIDQDGTNVPGSMPIRSMPFRRYHIRNTINTIQFRVDTNTSIVAGGSTNLGTGNFNRQKTLSVFRRESDNTRMMTYLNGSIAGGSVSDARIPNTQYSTRVLLSHSSGSERGNCKIKSFIIYKLRNPVSGTGISSADIARISNRQEPNSTSGLFKFLHYNMNEGSGITLNDLSGFGRNATLFNGPVWATDNSAPFALDREVFATVATNTIELNFNSTQDFKRSNLATFTTNAATRFLNVKATINESVGKVGISDIIIEELSTDGTTNPGSASYSEAV